MINIFHYKGGINMSEIQVQSQQELAPKDPRGGVICGIGCDGGVCGIFC